MDENVIKYYDLINKAQNNELKCCVPLTPLLNKLVIDEDEETRMRVLENLATMPEKFQLLSVIFEKDPDLDIKQLKSLE